MITRQPARCLPCCPLESPYVQLRGIGVHSFIGIFKVADAFSRKANKKNLELSEKLKLERSKLEILYCVSVSM